MKMLVDVSSVIYGGHNGNDVRMHGFPVGGIRKLFGIINAGLSQADFALCFDGGEIVKKELLPTYKAGRVPDYSVFAQVDLAKELLLKCDIPYYQDPKYEADDYVYSVCNELEMLGDTDDILIYTDDRDLACCVTDTTSIHHVTSNGIRITRKNYESRVVNGETIPYNTILLWKLFNGDPSDNYKALHIPGLNFANVAYNFVDTLSPLIGPRGFGELAFADYQVFEVFMKDYASIVSESAMKEVLQQARIAFPFKVPVSDTDIYGYRKDASHYGALYALERAHMKLFGNGNFNRRKFNSYCTMLGLNKTKPMYSIDRDSPEAKEFQTLLELRARELSDGTLAVEHYRTKRTVHPKGVSIKNMDLPI